MVLAAAFHVMAKMQLGRNVNGSRIAAALTPILTLFPGQLVQRDPLVPKELPALPAPPGRPDPLDRLGQREPAWDPDVYKRQHHTSFLESSVSK